MSLVAFGFLSSINCMIFPMIVKYFIKYANFDYFKCFDNINCMYAAYGVFYVYTVFSIFTTYRLALLFSIKKIYKKNIIDEDVDKLFQNDFVKFTNNIFGMLNKEDFDDEQNESSKDFVKEEFDEKSEESNEKSKESNEESEESEEEFIEKENEVFQEEIRQEFQNEFQEVQEESKKNIPLGDRMKQYEKYSTDITTIESDRPFIVRLDGRSFSKFTKPFKDDSEKTLNMPYSPGFKRVMILTAHDLLHEFNASTAYTHSDEITLVFNKAKISDDSASEHLFGGKVTKLLSLIPSYAASSFLTHLHEEFHFSQKVYDPMTFTKRWTRNKCLKFPSFDARIIVFPKDKEYEIVNHMMWRAKGDCTRNFISMYAEKHIGKNKLNGMTTNQRVQELKKYGIDLDDDIPDKSMKYGLFIKNTKRIIDQNKEFVDANNLPIRSVFYVFENLLFSDEMYDFLVAKTDECQNILDHTKLKTIKYTEDNLGELMNYEKIQHSRIELFCSNNI